MDFLGISYVALWAIVLLQGVVLLLLLRGAGTVFLNSRGGVSRDGLTLGQLAPDFDAVDATGKAVSLASFHGKWLVMIFANTACQVCWNLTPKLRDLRSALSGSTEIAVFLRDDVESAQEYARATDNALPVVAIGRRGTVNDYKVRVSPFAHVLDPSGTVRAKGIVNDVEHVEHLLYEGGLRDDRLPAHGDHKMEGAH